MLILRTRRRGAHVAARTSVRNRAGNFLSNNQNRTAAIIGQRLWTTVEMEVEHTSVQTWRSVERFSWCTSNVNSLEMHICFDLGK